MKNPQTTFIKFFEALMDHIDALLDAGRFDETDQFMEIRDRYIDEAERYRQAVSS